MKFNVSSELAYQSISRTTFIFNIQAAKSPTQIIIEESLIITPYIPYQEFVLGDARFVKLVAEPGQFFTITYKAIIDVQYRIIDENALSQIKPVIDFDANVLQYLFPSRHCQSDKLEKLALKEFGHISADYSRAVAITDWIFNHIDYISGSTDAGTSAYDTLIQRQGVCKDFAHLGIALCRTLHIPARYYTGYAYKLYPPDFHACFEAYIGGQWIFFDPTKLVPVNGLVKIANGKDAAEVAVANIFGLTNCNYVNVNCTAFDPDFPPFIPAPGKIEAVSYQ